MAVSVTNLILAAKAKATRTKAFLRVLKYSTGGVLEVTFACIFSWPKYLHREKVQPSTTVGY